MACCFGREKSAPPQSFIGTYKSSNNDTFTIERSGTIRIVQSGTVTETHGSDWVDGLSFEVAGGWLGSTSVRMLTFIGATADKDGKITSDKSVGFNYSDCIYKKSVDVSADSGTKSGAVAVPLPQTTV